MEVTANIEVASIYDKYCPQSVDFVASNQIAWSDKYANLFELTRFIIGIVMHLGESVTDVGVRQTYHRTHLTIY